MDISKLTQEELRALRLKIDFLLDDSGPSNGSRTFELRAYDALVESLKLHGIQSPPYPVFSKAFVFSAFRKQVGSFEQAVGTFCPKNRREELWVMRLLFRMLILDFQQRSIPVTTNIIAKNIVRAASILDQQFPGYKENHMLPLVLKRAYSHE